MAPTEFQESVYALTGTIPKGRVSTYKALADRLGSGPRAVGNALRRNPYAPIVPCHRVVKSDGTLGGFHGQTYGESLKRKRRMLQEEGVAFADSNKEMGVDKAPVCSSHIVGVEWFDEQGVARKGGGGGRVKKRKSSARDDDKVEGEKRGKKA